MKKLFCLLLSLAMLLSSAALAEDVPVDENAALTREELQIYLDALAETARQEGAEANADEGAAIGVFLPTVAFSGGTLTISDEAFTDTTAVVGAALKEETEDLRGLYIGAALDEVLRAYPNDNPSLAGSYYDAALYHRGEKPEVTVGYLTRVGQQAIFVRYEVYSWQPDGVAVSSITYFLENGYVSQIHIALNDQLLDENVAQSDIQDVADMQEISEYTPYPVSMDDGESLAPFDREDLTITQFGQKVADFLDLTAEDLNAALGSAPVDEWTEDSDGSLLRTLQWEGISVLLRYNAQRQFTAVVSVTINDVNLEGPRGVRVGDSLDSVIYRFRHAEILYADDTVLLYGDGQTVPYGALVYTPENAEVTYAVSVGEGRTVVWHMTFVIGELQSMTLMLR